MNKTMRDALNAQIDFEFESAYMYLAMAICMREEKYPGFGKWLQMQYQEELAHAHKLIDFVEECDQTVVIKDIKMHKITSKDPLVIAKAVLKHEQMVTSKIHALYEQAYEEKDYATHQMLSWFVAEQVEEEANARNIIDMFTFAGESRASQMLVDSKLGGRQG